MSSFLMEIITLGVVIGLAGCSNPETNTAGGGGELPDDLLGVSFVASAGELEPAFDEAVLDYTLVVENKYKSVEFSSSKNGVDEKIEVTGAGSLNEGANAVTVTLANGTVYNITVIRLPSVSISKITISASDFQNNSVILENPGVVINQTLPYHDNPPPVTVKFQVNPPVAPDAVFTITGSIGGVAVSSGQIADVAIALNAAQAGEVETSVSFEVNGMTYRANKTYKVTLARPAFQPVATGGHIEKITADDGTIYEIHTFTSNDSFVVSQSLLGKPVDVLVVGGGGGGGGGYLQGAECRGAGGGAGRFIYETNYPLIENTIDIVIGAGGAGTTHNKTNPNKDGGSGGGATNAAYSTANLAGKASADSGMGNDGGTAKGDYSAAGGGGAGAPGENVTTSKSGSAGGDGLECDISGEALWYAGGGGAGGAMDGGKGGGGKGAPKSGTDAGSDGEAGTGGGGAYDKKVDGIYYSAAGNGGSGIVIVRFPYQPSVP